MKPGTAAIIAFRLLPSRPLPWVPGIDFCAGWKQKNQITLEIDILQKYDVITYTKLTQWMHHNVPNNTSHVVDHVQAATIWGIATGYVIFTLQHKHDIVTEVINMSMTFKFVSYKIKVC